MSALKFTHSDSFQQPTSGYATRITQDEWQKYEKTIRDLHGKKTKQLEILQHLSDYHDFHPSSSQLASQLKKWDLSIYKTRTAALKDGDRIQSTIITLPERLVSPLSTPPSPQGSVPSTETLRENLLLGSRGWIDDNDQYSWFVVANEALHNWMVYQLTKVLGIRANVKLVHASLLWEIESIADTLASGRLFSVAFDLYHCLYSASAFSLSGRWGPAMALCVRSAVNCLRTATSDTQRKQAVVIQQSGLQQVSNQSTCIPYCDLLDAYGKFLICLDSDWHQEIFYNVRERWQVCAQSYEFEISATEQFAHGMQHLPALQHLTNSDTEGTVTTTSIELTCTWPFETALQWCVTQLKQDKEFTVLTGSCHENSGELCTCSCFQRICGYLLMATAKGGDEKLMEMELGINGNMLTLTTLDTIPLLTDIIVWPRSKLRPRLSDDLDRDCLVTTWVSHLLWHPVLLKSLLCNAILRALDPFPAFRVNCSIHQTPELHRQSIKDVLTYHSLDFKLSEITQNRFRISDARWKSLLSSKTVQSELFGLSDARPRRPVRPLITNEAVLSLVSELETGLLTLERIQHQYQERGRKIHPRRLRTALYQCRTEIKPYVNEALTLDHCTNIIISNMIRNLVWEMQDSALNLARILLGEYDHSRTPKVFRNMITTSYQISEKFQSIMFYCLVRTSRIQFVGYPCFSGLGLQYFRAKRITEHHPRVPVDGEAQSIDTISTKSSTRFEVDSKVRNGEDDAANVDHLMNTDTHLERSDVNPQTTHELAKYNCVICLQHFHTIDEATIHVMSQHSRTLLWVCDRLVTEPINSKICLYCWLSGPSYSVISQSNCVHIRSCTAEGDKCPIFFRSDDFLDHLNHVHNIPRAIFEYYKIGLDQLRGWSRLSPHELIRERKTNNIIQPQPESDSEPVHIVGVAQGRKQSQSVQSLRSQMSVSSKTSLKNPVDDALGPSLDWSATSSLRSFWSLAQRTRIKSQISSNSRGTLEEDKMSIVSKHSRASSGSFGRITGMTRRSGSVMSID